MDERNEVEVNFANKTKEERLRELYNLKSLYEQAKGNNYNPNIDDYINNSQEGNEVRGAQTSAHMKTLSTPVGRAMAEKPRQSGFSSALMLGIVSFIFEALFLALAIFIYQ